MTRISLLALAIGLTVAAQSQELYKTSFEQPTFVPGPLFDGAVGQGGWLSTTTVPLIVGATGGVTPHDGTQMYELPSRPNLASAGGRWAWVDVSPQWNGRTAGNNVAVGTTMLYVPSSNTVDCGYGLDVYDPSGGVRYSLTYYKPNTGSLFFFGDGSGWEIANALQKDQWNEVKVCLDFGGQTAYLYLNGQYIVDAASSVATSSAILGDFDLYGNTQPLQEFVGNGYFDSFKVEAMPDLPSVIRGTVQLNDYFGDMPATVDVEIREPGTTNIIASGELSIGAGGEYALISPLIGPVDVAIKKSHWLREVQFVDTTNGPQSGVNFALINGDIDEDNVITVFDYNALSDAFDSADGDPNWNPNADLDGDGGVTVFDYNILSANFDVYGDE